MATQEEMTTGIANLLRLAIDQLDKPEFLNINYEMAQNLIRQAVFKYMDLCDCPFRDACRERFEGEYEDDDPEPPYNWRDDRD